MLNKEEAKESIDSYLGDKEKEVLKTLTPSTLRLFMSKKIQLDKSYYILGTQTLLKQFKAFYLVNCLKETNRPKYSMQMISDRAQMLSGGATEDLGADEVLFLYAHKVGKDIGKTEEWLAKTIVSDVANRNRKGYVTIILTERRIDLIKECGEVIPVVLNLKTKNLKIKSTSENHGGVSTLSTSVKVDNVDNAKYKSAQ
jgi:hypothetical protein